MTTLRLSPLIVLLLLAPGPDHQAEDGSEFRIDTHLHLHPRGLDAAMGHSGGSGARPDGRRDRRGDEASDGLAEAARQMVLHLDRVGIDRALVVSVPSHHLAPEDDLELVRRAVSGQPRLALLAGGATLGSRIFETEADDVGAAALESFSRTAHRLLDEGAVGFGEMISLHLCLTERHNFQWAPADHPLFLELARVAAGRDVPLDLHMEAVTEERPMPASLRRACSSNPERIPASIPALERLLDRRPETRVVWQHVGWDNVGELSPMLVARLLADHPNLFVGLRVEVRSDQVGGGGPMPHRLVDGHGRLDPAWKELLLARPERFVLGADEFVGPDGRRPRGAASLDETWDLLGQLPSDVARAIGGENARRIYGL